MLWGIAFPDGSRWHLDAWRHQQKERADHRAVGTCRLVLPRCGDRKHAFFGTIWNISSLNNSFFMIIFEMWDVKIPPIKLYMS